MEFEKSKNAESTPTTIVLDTNEWWVKILAMLQHNWAVINEHEDGTATAYFFHDGGTTKNPTGYHYKSIQSMIAIVDSIDFSNQKTAAEGLLRNGFVRLADLPGPWQGNEPRGAVFDARLTESGIYSKQGYWKND